MQPPEERIGLTRANAFTYTPRVPSHPEIAYEMLARSADAIRTSLSLTDQVVEVAERIADGLEGGGKLLVCGNGGSAGDAQHFAGELMGRFQVHGRKARPAVALTTDSSVLTGIANDYGFDDIFANQVVGLARTGDILVGISTSGSSTNVLRAFDAAPQGVLRVALTGPGGALAERADLALRVQAEGIAPIQAAHISIIHAICAVLEARFATTDG